MLPRERRVRLEVTTDGRHLTFLLTALGEAGHGVHVVGAPFVFRELMLLRKSAPMPFVSGGKARDCGIWITDKRAGSPLMADSGELMADGRKKTKQGAGSREHGGGFAESSTLFVLDYDYFSGLPAEVVKGGAEKPSTSNPLLATAPEVPMLDSRPLSLDSSSEALRAPYFMHPSVYHRGLHKRRSPSTALDSRLSTFDSAAKRRRRFRLGFFGTHDREFYTKHYHFPGMNRFEILEVFLKNFGDRITPLRGFLRDWEPCEIAVSIDDRGGDRQGKSFLSQEHYFEALRECDFVLSPPGICTPLSHNLIEAMFCGAIPITNAGAFMAQPLENGKNCLSFSGETDLIAAIVRALTMSEQEVGKMREVVLNYYNNNLHPNAFCEQLGSKAFDQIFVNTEEKSVPFVYQEFIWPPHNQ